MSVLQAVILGVIQGLTEFLPISSSAHFVIFPALVGWNRSLPAHSLMVFDVVLHAGTLVAVLAYFRTDIISIVAGTLRDFRARQLGRDSKMVGFLILASIPAAVVGLKYRGFLERLFQNPVGAGVFLVVTAAILLSADFVARNALSMDDMNMTRALVVGLAQALAIIPGVSRSAATISAGIWSGLRRQEAARFSFLLAIPITFGRFLLELRDLGAAHVGLWPNLAGFLTSAVVGYACIAFLLEYLSTHKLRVFAVYCAVAGTLTIGYFLLQ